MFLFLGLPVERVTLSINETDDMNNERTAEQPWAMTLYMYISRMYALIMTEGALELKFKETVREAVNNVLYSYYKYGATDPKKVLITSNTDFGIVCVIKTFFGSVARYL